MSKKNVVEIIEFSEYCQTKTNNDTYFILKHNVAVGYSFV